MILCSEISCRKWVKEIQLAGPVSLCVCPSILAPGARTAGPIGTGEGSFDVPERQKDDGANCGAIGATWHVARANVPTLAKINNQALQAEQIDARQRNSAGRLSSWGDAYFWGCHSPGLGRCHSVKRLEYRQVDYVILRTMCHVPLARGTYFTLLLLVLEWMNGFGPDRLCSARNNDSNIIRSIAICFVPLGTCQWRVAHDLMNLVIAAERLIRFGPD